MITWAVRDHHGEASSHTDEAFSNDYIYPVIWSRTEGSLSRESPVQKVTQERLTLFGGVLQGCHFDHLDGPEHAEKMCVP